MGKKRESSIEEHNSRDPIFFFVVLTTKIIVSRAFFFFFCFACFAFASLQQKLIWHREIRHVIKVIIYGTNSIKHGVNGVRTAKKDHSH